MPPKKRKASEESGAASASPTPKKSKKEIRAEAKARAKAWADGRKGGKSSPLAATPAASTTTTTAKKSSPSFSVGKSGGGGTASTPPRSAAKRRRTPSRKSTGGIGVAAAGAGISRTRSSNEKEGGTPVVKRGRRSVGSRIASAGFEFVPPAEGVKEDEEAEEEETSESETRDAAVGTQSTNKKSPVKYEFGGSDEKKPSAAKKKREDGRARLRALREERESQGLKVSHGTTHREHHYEESTHRHAARAEDDVAERKCPPKGGRSPDPPAAAPPPAAARTSSNAIDNGLNSPDPPAASKPPARAKASSAASASAKRAFAGVAKSGASNKNKPPAAVASIFARPKSSKNSAHRPHRQRFDPNQPFPSTGHRLPTAAYCGCGPTPGSTTSSVRGPAGGDLGSAIGAYEDMGRIEPVDPPYGSTSHYAGLTDDRKQMPHGGPYSPPGRNAGWEGAVAGEGAKGKGAPVPVSAGAVPAKTNDAPLSAAITANVPAPGAPPANTPGMLSAAVSRASALLSSAALGNRERRAMMGIPSANVGPKNEDGGNRVGAPPRGAMTTMTEREMDEANAAALDGEGEEEEVAEGPIDPPVIDPSSVSYGATLQKFHGAGEGPNVVTSSETKTDTQVKKEPDGDTETTDAGEHTSEVGKDEEVNLSLDSERAVRPVQKRSSFLWRACLSIMKLIMFVQMGIGVLYLSTITSFDWKNYVPSKPLSLQPSDDNAPGTLDTPKGEEKPSSCFIDYPERDIHPGGEEDQNFQDMHGCEGNYKQCPSWGRCQEGKLKDCADADGVYEGLHRFVPNENGDGCEVSSEAKELVGMVTEVLMGMSAAQTCKSSERVKDADDVLLVDDAPFPLFRLERVAQQVREVNGEKAGLMSPDFLLWLHPTFDSDSVRFGALSGDDGDDLDAVGLESGVSPNSLPLPLACTLKLVCWELLGYFATSAWELLTFSFLKVWFLVCQYPVYSLGLLAFWKVVCVFRTRSKHRAKVRELFGTVLEATYDRLSECEDREGYAALHLRDDVGFSMYPTSFLQRDFLYQHVWPRVILEIRSDNRVRKFRRMRDGKELEHWDFATQPKRARKLRKSLGTPGSKLGEVKEVTPKQRDP